MVQGAPAPSTAEEDAQAWQAILTGRWPFQQLCSQCCIEVLAQAWETRHGAAVGLREVLRSHAFGAGVHATVVPYPTGNHVPVACPGSMVGCIWEIVTCRAPASSMLIPDFIVQPASIPLPGLLIMVFVYPVCMVLHACTCCNQVHMELPGQ